jgi:hypothetical protein
MPCLLLLEKTKICEKMQEMFLCAEPNGVHNDTKCSKI